MDILTKKAIKEQLSAHETELKHSLGQNYLISARSIQAYINHFIYADEMIEIGPGIGNITINYFRKYKKVTLIEIDTQKIPLLRENLTAYNGGIFPEWVTIINADFFSLDISSFLLGGTAYEITGALPYNLSKKIMHSVLTLLPTPSQATFILQREVADKYVLKAPDASFLSISSQMLAHIKRHEILSKNDFYPIPRVDSRIITIDSYTFADAAELQAIEKVNFFIHQCFLHPRKKIRGSLYKKTHVPITAQQIEKRPQELTTTDWKWLYEAINQPNP